MDALPSNIILDIFSRIPVKCLARLRCVSKLWRGYIDDPYLGIIHRKRVVEEPTVILFRKETADNLWFYVLDSVHTRTPKRGLGCEVKTPLFPCSDYVANLSVRGSCNGLLLVSQDNTKVVTRITLILPLKRLHYELPDLPSPLRLPSNLTREAFGLGFDASTNTLKIVCVLFRQNPVPPGDPDLVRRNLCTMVHDVYSHYSWREIPQVPFYPIDREFIFTDGCLYWLASRSDSRSIIEEGGREVIWFDVTKEEFGLINPPTNIGDYSHPYSMGKDHLVDLDGQLGYVCNSKVWVLSRKKEWMLHFHINLVPSNGYFKVLGCWNKDGEVLIEHKRDRGVEMFYVYCHKSDRVDKAHLGGINRRPYARESGVIIYRNTMCSIHHGVFLNYSCFEKMVLKFYLFIRESLNL